MHCPNKRRFADCRQARPSESAPFTTETHVFNFRAGVAGLILLLCAACRYLPLSLDAKSAEMFASNTLWSDPSGSPANFFMALEADNALLRQQIARLELGARACEVICRRPVISKLRQEPRRLF